LIKHVWIDADSCPLLVRNYVIKHSAKINIPVTFVANKKISCTEAFPYEMIVTEEKKDSADNYILEHAEKNELVITRDLLFADKLLQKEITAINDRGTLFTREIINKHLEDREFDLQLAEIGLVKHFNNGYDKKKLTLFAKCFNKVINS